MANAEVDGVELELEVSFNEFDDETIADENAGENKNRASEIPSAVCKVALDDGEILDTVVGRSGVHANGNSPARDSNSNQFSGNTKADRTNELQRLKDGREPRGANTTMREQRKRKLSCSMEVDDEPGVDRGNKVKKKARGGQKKKKRHSPNHPHRRFQPKDQDKELHYLLQPLTISHKSPVKKVVEELAERLQERKIRLIHRVVQSLGYDLTLKLFDETKRMQLRGGLPTVDGSRRRSSGGVFLTLLKSDQFATKNQIKEIFAEENEILKNAKKAKLAQQKELKRKEIQELRKNQEQERPPAEDVEMKAAEQQLACAGTSTAVKTTTTTAGIN